MSEFSIHRAANVEEAVETATRFQKDGRYNWFRGQVRDWPPYSSLYRIQQAQDDERSQRASRRIVMFLDWMRQTPELTEVFEHPDAAVAVAQHYGIPSHYVDFTTQPGVAGFFAADTKDAPNIENNACIFCLNTDDLTDFWRCFSPIRPEAHLELVTIDVSNLWRLEAQKGRFLLCDYNWDVDYPMDRILFPGSGYPSWPTREVIYPPQKSSLELVLDQYFDIEKRTLAAEWWQGFFKELISQGNRNIHIHHEETPELRYRAEAVRESGLPVLASWEPTALQSWAKVTVERMEETIAAPIVLQVRPAQSHSESAKSISYGVRQLLRTKPRSRQTVFDWELRQLTFPSGLENTTLSQALQTVWNGMRNLPYTDDEVATACGATAHLFLDGFSVRDSLAVANRVLGDCFEVEFAALDGSSSRGYLTRDSLRSALRKDLKKFASDRLLHAMQMDVRWVLQAIFSPSRLLDFDQLRFIFAKELIPTQVLSRTLVLFSPARLDTFGLP